MGTHNINMVEEKIELVFIIFKANYLNSKAF